MDYVNKGVHEAVKFLLVDGRGRVLVEKRSKDKRVFPSMLAIPAGHVDVKDLKAPDYKLVALKRESREELNLVPKYIRYMNKCVLTVLDRRYRVFYYLCSGFDSSKIPKVSSEKAHLRWISLKEALSLPLEIDKKALSTLKKHRTVIAVTGTPGTGKTALSKQLAKTLNFGYLSLSKAIKDGNLSEGYDREKRCQIVSIARLNAYLKSFLSSSHQSWVLDGHLSHYLPRGSVDLVISCTTELKTLQRRLKKRGYSEAKIRENLDSEIFSLCTQEAKEKGHALLVLDTTKRSISSLIKEAITHLPTP